MMLTTTDEANTTTTPTEFTIRAGNTLPYGAVLVPGGVNFSVFSCEAESCTLVLFRPGEEQPFAEIPFPEEHKIGRVFCMQVDGLDWQNVEYGFRMDGPNDPPAGLYFNPDNILLDPYADQVTGRGVWRDRSNTPGLFPHRARIVDHSFDWEGDRPLQTPIEDLVIYEMHVRSFTAHPSSSVQYPGTYAGLTEQIRYLKWLG